MNKTDTKHYAGLDLSLTQTGFCVLDAKGGVVCAEAVSVPRTGGDVRRLIGYREEIRKRIETFRPEFVMLEGYAMRASGRVFSLGEQGGVIRALLYDLGIRTGVTSPQGIKKFATGKGNGDKTAVAMGAFKKWGVEFGNDNITDAYVAARMAVAYALTGYDPLTSYQRDAMGKVEEIIVSGRVRNRNRKNL